MQTQRLGIDVETKDAKNTLRRLKGLKSTKTIEGPYPYNQDLSYSQILIETTMTEDELDQWLWATKGVNYTGVFTR